MTRVSLREAYDNKDVVAQIYAIRDTAESAVDTSEQAVTTANTASDHVDALVPQVEGAVANANSASASAQASAQTVAGYENRLATVEDATEDLAGDLNAVTLRVTTAEGQIVTIQGRVTALETADGQNVKINAINDYAVGLTGNQTKSGELTLTTWLQIAGGHDRSLVRLNNSRFDSLASGQSEGILSVFNTNGVYIGGLVMRQDANGVHRLQLNLLNSDGTTVTTVTLGTSA